MPCDRAGCACGYAQPGGWVTLETVVAERAALARELYAVKARLAKAEALLERVPTAFAAHSYAFLREVKDYLDAR